MQPYLFPYIGYFQLLDAVDRFVVYDDVAFIKQGWINRNRMLVNGSASYFTVPVRHASSFTLIRDTLVDDGAANERWTVKMLRSFGDAYRRAPEFPRVFPMLEAVLTRPVRSIADLAVASLKAVCGFLDIRADWVDTSARYGNAHLTGAARVIDICKVEGATEYVNVPGGRALYSPEAFEAQGVRLRFIEPRLPEYRQFRHPFVPALSIIDVLMFNSRETVRAYLAAYELA